MSKPDNKIIPVVLWVDDELADSVDFIDNAAAAGIVVHPYENSEDGLAKLHASYREFDALVLDAWGRSAPGKKGADPQSLDQLRNQLNDLAIRFGYSIPHCVYTGHMGDIQYLSAGTPKFNKEISGDLDRLFTWIHEKAEQRIEHRIMSQHSDVFAVFKENLLPEDKKWELVRLLKDIDTRDAPTIKAHNALARTFIEPIMEGLQTLGSDYMPEEILSAGRLNADSAIRYLTGRSVEIKGLGTVVRTLSPPGVIIPDHLGWMLSMLFKTPTFTGSHGYRKKHTEYAHRSVVNALCELLIWYHDLIMSKHSK